MAKNSGHGYLGRSNGPYSLSIWFHHMKGIHVHQPDSYAPPTARVDGSAMTTAAGTEMLEVYTATAPLNLAVALGGFITGGGHGLAVDHVLEIGMVDPSGRLLTLDECTNEELFYAVRGVSEPGIGSSGASSLAPHVAGRRLDLWRLDVDYHGDGA